MTKPTKLPNEYSDDEWNVLSENEQRASWSLVVDALSVAISRVHASDPWVKEKIGALADAIREAERKVLRPS
jgi:hypothetical protein